MKEGKFIKIFINNRYSTYEIITLLRRYSYGDPYNKLFTRDIFVISDSLSNILNGRD
jgi:hypothetical protein